MKAMWNWYAIYDIPKIKEKKKVSAYVQDSPAF